MNTKNRMFFTLLVLLLNISLLLAACNLPSSESSPTQSVDTIDTAVAATLAAKVQPSATAAGQNESTATPTPAPACDDKMNIIAWKRDGATYDAKAAKTPLAPTAPFTLSWTFQNTGTCTWDAGYEMVYESGTGMTQSTHYPILLSSQTVAPGELAIAKVDMIAPAKVGDYQAIWRMQNKAGQVLGTFDVRLTVANVSSLVPARPDNLTYTFECSTDSIAITLTWTDTASNEEGYHVYRDGTLINELSTGATSYTDNVPRINGYYTYTVLAFNSAGESKAATMAAKNAQSVCP